MKNPESHWMRHSHASHAIAGGMPVEIAQQNLGHASLATTTLYVTTEKRRRMKAVENFWKGWFCKPIRGACWSERCHLIEGFALLATQALLR